MKPLNGGVDCYHTMFNTHTHTPAAAKGVYIWGGGGGQLWSKR